MKKKPTHSSAISSIKLDHPERGELWVMGWLACATAGGAAVAAALGLEGESWEWAQYLMLGSLFPAGLLAIHWPSRPNWPKSEGSTRTALAGLSAIGGLAGLAITAYLISPWALLGAALQLTADRLLWKESNPWPTPWRAGFALLFWSIAWKALFWKTPSEWLGGSVWTVACALFFLAAAPALFSTLKPLPRAARWTLDTAIVIVFALGSSRLALDKDVEFLVGSATLARQGGWLLWDVPSQYGFLNILALAFAPFSTVWQSVYALNSALIFASALLVYFSLRKLGSGLLQTGIAALLAYAVVLMMPGYLPQLMGPNSLPSVGGFRFVWAYALWVWAVLSPRAPHSAFSTAMGGVIWLLGVYWSFESACFVSVIWAAAVLTHPHPWRAIVGSTIGLAASVALLCAFYSARLGQLPDFRGYFEYALSYQGGFGSLPIEWNKGVWIPVLTIALLAHVAVTSPAVFARTAISAATLWAVCSYFVSRSHENNLSNLAPFVTLALASALFTGSAAEAAVQSDLSAPQAAAGARARALVRAFWIPLIVVIGTISWGNFERLPWHFGSVFASRGISAIHWILPNQEPRLLELLGQAGVKTDEPIAHFSYRILFNTLATNSAPASERARVPEFFLPVGTASQLGILSPERQRVYLERFARRRPRSGWLLEPKDILSRSPPVVTLFSGDRVTHPGLAAEVLSPTHQVTRRFENDGYRLEWFELRR